jgi:subtilase family protein
MYRRALLLALLASFYTGLCRADSSFLVAQGELRRDSSSPSIESDAPVSRPVAPTDPDDSHGDQPPASPPVDASPNQQTIGVRISFQGDVVGRNVALVLSRVYEQSPALLKPEQYSPADGDTVCGILQARGYPPPCDDYLPLIDRINQSPVSKRPLAKTPLTIPGLKLRQNRSIREFSKLDANENKRGNDLLVNWQFLGATRIEARSPNTFAISFTTYNLLVSTEDDSSANALFERLVPYRSLNIVINLLTNGVNPPAKLHGSDYTGFPDSTDVQVDCHTGDLKHKGENGLPVYRYDGLMNGDKDAVQAMKSGLTQSPPETASVVLIDTVLDSEIHGALESWSCKWGKFIDSLHHANHLRGIINSAGPINLFEGVADHTQVSNYSWWKPADDNPNKLAKGSTERATDLAEIFNGGYTSRPLPIYLAATDFDGYSDKLKNSEGQLVAPEKRFGREPEQTILRARPLLIVAAGQDSAPIALSTVSAHSPQNLGDFENVVVVTACSQCGPSFELYKQAYFSAQGQRMVHVAAPGVALIAGWIDNDNLGAAGGTSQSAAMVAGVAASMISHFPHIYTDPRSIKIRLQTTSRPMPPLPDGTANPDAAKITAGIVDPILALLDPTKHWLKQNGTWSSVKVRRWSTDNFNVLNTSRNPASFKSASVLRIINTQRGTATDPTSVFTLYVDELKNGTGPAGAVQRFDLVSKLGPTTLVLCDGTNVSLPKVDDLIVSMYGITSHDCQ